MGRANRLAHETSPYLLQHAENPVDWYPWGSEALVRAKKESKPILLSIGYSACHWCHVMEEESFSDPEIAALMNDHFVCIKVDREERPDLDEVYMAATIALNNGQGGWPMTVFLTPDQKPFFAGTYFPPHDMAGRPGFRSVLTSLAESWGRSPDVLRRTAENLTDHLSDQYTLEGAQPVGRETMADAAEHWGRIFDPIYGGFGGAPKFPPSGALMALMRVYQSTRQEEVLDRVTKTLDSLAAGGIYDHLGGGFARYSVDAQWLVPHFEKMLYDNALLVLAYLEAYQLVGEERYADVVRETLSFVEEKLLSAEGGFYSALDADSEGEEGRYYVWTLDEVEEVLDKDEARCFCAYYDVTPNGNWESKTVLHVPHQLGIAAKEVGIPREKFEALLKSAKEKLKAVRERRIPPSTDDKVIVSWNGLMVAAFAEAGRVLDEEQYIQRAAKAADFLLNNLRNSDGSLARTYREGERRGQGCLEDYAYLAFGLLHLYESGGQDRFRDEAKGLGQTIMDQFRSDTGAFYSTSHGHESLFLRHREGTDSALPNPNAVAALILARLSWHKDRPDFAEAAKKAIGAYGQTLTQYPQAFAWSLIALDFLLHPPLQLRFVGDQVAAIKRQVATVYLPRRVILHEMGKAGGELVVCRGQTCLLPITDPGAVIETLLAALQEGEEGHGVIGEVTSGNATLEGTQRYAQKHGAESFQPLGTLPLHVSKMGFGTYRVDDETPTHAEALRFALQSGVNLIDTSTNYADGASERCIGKVFSQMIEEGDIQRDEVVVVSKVGYVQGHNLQMAQQRENSGHPYPDMVKYTDTCWHCIHPEFLKDQLPRSLGRLHLGTLDIVLLHNPEYFLAQSWNEGHHDLEKNREAFYQRIRDAFAFFEEQVAQGTITAYGVSSNSIGFAEKEHDATSLATMLQIAEEVGGADHHFKVVQLPLNLLEGESVLVKNQGKSVLDLAQEKRIAVLANRPLNAIRGGAMVRLVDAPFSLEAIHLPPIFGAMKALEEEWRQNFASQVQTGEGSVAPDDFFQMSEILPQLEESIPSLEVWEQIEQQRFIPQLSYLFSTLDNYFAEPMQDGWIQWRDQYWHAIKQVFAEYRRRGGIRSRETREKLIKMMRPYLPDEKTEVSLARKALWIVASTPGVTCVLNGMRRNRYVEDALEVATWSKLEGVEALYLVAAKISLD